MPRTSTRPKHPSKNGRAPSSSTKRASTGDNASAGQPEHARHTIARVVEVERQHEKPSGFSQQAAELVTAFAGSMLFVWIHVVWYGGWIAWNLAPGVSFDPPPFSTLTLVVSLEAIFLSTFVLISQNRQARRADERAMVDLEVNVIAEQELTKLFKLVADVHDHLGASDRHDPRIDDMLKDLDIAELFEETARKHEEGD
jgi:uncharacterized membrane protein